MDGLLDMLRELYKVEEQAHAKTSQMSEMLMQELIVEYAEMARKNDNIEKMKQRLEVLENESSKAQKKTQERRKDVCQRCRVLSEQMENSLMRGLGYKG